MRENRLHTVCESASCPNLGECWSTGTATFMILGNTCTRGCRFCDVNKGRPETTDWDEPMRIAESVKILSLKYVVLTSVTRDDLKDQGADIWAQTIKKTRELSPSCRIECLIPDMQGNTQLVDHILKSNPDVLNHNFETVPRLQKKVRGRGNMSDSSEVLYWAKARGFCTKTSLMLGLGETKEEVEEILHHIASLKVDIVTLGQYLQPSASHLKVERFVSPDEFEHYRQFSRKIGIKRCVSGPLVRSSYKADSEYSQLLASQPTNQVQNSTS